MKKENALMQKKILNKARELFLEHGYSKTSMRNIATAAGISTWPLYTYFKDKTEIYTAICAEGYDILISSMEKITKSKKSAPAKLKDSFFAYKDFYYNHAEYSRLIKSVLNPSSGIEMPEDLKKMLFDKEKRVHEVMEEMVKEGIANKMIRPLDPRAFVLFLCCNANGIFELKDAGILKHFEISIDNVVENMLEYVGYAMIGQNGIK